MCVCVAPDGRPVESRTQVLKKKMLAKRPARISPIIELECHALACRHNKRVAKLEAVYEDDKNLYLVRPLLNAPPKWFPVRCGVPLWQGCGSSTQRAIKGYQQRDGVARRGNRRRVTPGFTWVER